MPTSPTSQLSPKRQRTRNRRLAAIVEAAFDIIEDDSLEALKMGRLAKAVDLTPGALYRYFPSKDALIAALEAHAVERIATQLEKERTLWQPALPDVHRELCELVAAASFYLELTEREPRAFRLVAATLGETRPLVDDDSAQEVAVPLRKLILAVSTLFDAATETGALTPGSAPLRTIVLWTSLHGVMMAQKLDRLTEGAGWFASAPLANELITALLHGWGAPPEAVAYAKNWQRSRTQTETAP